MSQSPSLTCLTFFGQGLLKNHCCSLRRSYDTDNIGARLASDISQILFRVTYFDELFSIDNKDVQQNSDLFKDSSDKGKKKAKFVYFFDFRSIRFGEGPTVRSMIQNLCSDMLRFRARQLHQTSSCVREDFRSDTTIVVEVKRRGSGRNPNTQTS